ncbi:NADAR family protein [Micromonospora sp. ALFpr18c]|uniref:NADAR family protein n=1 Tax=Micromonospora sp. ALFpr18c TaxID=1458665 RepID=UPI00124B90F2|nr:NADAR family protein [Micromonospora sp. ALFpr18c]KAB1927662.1 NADAR family protein [Micromonospora sp. ALFpr18c]
MDPRTVTDLVDLVTSGRRVKFLHFWGHQPQPDGSVGAGCLSQWWPARFAIDGREFATAEHYMMWAKAILFGDTSIAEQVLTASHPHRAKTLGRQVQGFDQPVWEANRYGIVVEGSVAKFGQHADLRAYLLGTGDRILVEASPLDGIWGIGLTADEPFAADPSRWKGLNLLGFALMHTRQRLRQDSQ